MNERVDAVLGRLTRAPGVRGGAVVDAEAGVAVAADVAMDVEVGALAAMAASLFGRTADASLSSGFGKVRLMQLDAADGHVVVAGAGPLLVVVLMEADAQLGLVRVEAARAAEELRG